MYGIVYSLIVFAWPTGVLGARTSQLLTKIYAVLYQLLLYY